MVGAPDPDQHACNVFAVARGAGRRVFLGASPERLVRVDGRTVRATSLAGSIARGSGPEEDARRAAELMASAKDREEHDIVVRALTSAPPSYPGATAEES